MLGVLMMNTGTPDAPTEEAIRPYLKQFLSDRNLIDMPSLLWQPILNWCILPRRPKRTAPIYQAFWTEQGSPFMLTSYEQRDKLRAKLAELTGGANPENPAAGEPVVVELAMRYGNPSIALGIEALLDAGADCLMALPLYPQRTKPCAGTCLQEFNRQLERICVQRNMEKPQVIQVEEYWNAPGYLDVLAASVRQDFALHGVPEKLLVSFHSIPVSNVEEGDTYPQTTQATARALADLLGMNQDDVLLTYQSRFDSRKWVGPFLPAELQRLAAQGVRNVAVLCPGFSVDCTETVHEVGKEAAQVFLSAAAAAQGETDDAAPAAFRYVPALGASDKFMDVLARVILERA